MDPSVHRADKRHQQRQSNSDEPMKTPKTPAHRRTKTEQKRQENANESTPMNP
jgi:hypothetical protein